MRARAVVPRYFYPWDPLQLDEEVVGGFRARKNSLNFQLYKVYRNQLLWTPLLFRNYLYCYGDGSELEVTLRNMLKQSVRDNRETVTFEFFSFSDSLKSLAMELDDFETIFRYHPFNDSLEAFVDALLEHRELLRGKLVEEKLSEASNRLKFIFVSLTARELTELEDRGLKEKIFDLLKNSVSTRLYLFCLLEDAESFPVELLLSFDTVVGIGADNIDYCVNEAFTELEVSPYSFAQETVGIMFLKDFEKLYFLHPLKFAPTEWFKQRELDRKAEEDLYREFLDSLDDGS